MIISGEVNKGMQIMSATGSVVQRRVRSTLTPPSCYTAVGCSGEERGVWK